MADLSLERERKNKNDIEDSLDPGFQGAKETQRFRTEVANFVTTSGQELTPANGSSSNLYQIPMASAIYGMGASTFTDTGTANSYVLTPMASGLIVPSNYDLLNGCTVMFKPNNSNTGAASAQISGYGDMPILTPSNVPLVANMMLNTEYCILLFILLSPGVGNWILLNPAHRTFFPGDQILLPFVPAPTYMTARRLFERDGTAKSKTAYSELYAALYSSEKNKCIYGETATEFNLPDDRGLFERVWNHGRYDGITEFLGDPDAAGRLDRGDGTTGDFVGTTQFDEFGEHTHECEHYFGSDSTGAGLAGAPIDDEETYITGESGGKETRGKNIYRWGGIFY